MIVYRIQSGDGRFCDGKLWPSFKWQGWTWSSLRRVNAYVYRIQKYCRGKGLPDPFVNCRVVQYNCEVVEASPITSSPGVTP